MKILAIISGEYGNRHVENLKANGPDTWEIQTWQTPPVFPPFIDDPEDFLPDEMPASDLLLSFAEHKGAAELLPDISKRTGASAVQIGTANFYDPTATMRILDALPDALAELGAKSVGEVVGTMEK